MTDNPLAAQAAPVQAGQVNWGDLMSQAGSGFDPLPDGTYDVQVTEATAATTAKGKTMFKITFTVLSGPHANRKLWTNLTVSPESPAALGIFFSQMAALGLDKTFFQGGPTPESIAASLMGKSAIVTTTTREWGGTLRNEVKTIKPPASGGNAAFGLPPAPQAPSATTGAPVAPQAPF